MTSDQKVVLVIMDGFGLLPQIEGNAIIQAKTPFFDHLVTHHKSTAVQASGEAVGLPWGEMGNSEVGHLNMGTGRVVLQDYPQINKAITDGSFFKNPILVQATDYAKHYKGRLHFIGLVSKGAVHAHIDHLYGLLDLAKKQGIKDVFVHAILDGRDAPAKSAPGFIGDLISYMGKLEVGQLATMVGRYFAMDRDRRWDRTRIAYDSLVEGKDATIFTNPLESLQAAYHKGESDEFIKPMIKDRQSRIKNGDAIVFFNFRADRAIQLTKAFVDEHFEGFSRPILKKLFFVTLTNYEHKLSVDVAFTPIMLNDPKTNPLAHCLSEVISKHNLPQIHIAETEKYAHVTYFFNAGREDHFTKEFQTLVPSPKVSTYDKTPAMSIEKIVTEFMKEFQKNQASFSVINFANADMVGHTGDIKASIKAVQAMDEALKKVVVFARQHNAVILVTGDHGNAEQMINPVTKAIDKEHSINPVPLVLVESDVANLVTMPPIKIDQKIDFHATKPVGIFADVAPTILDYLGLPAPGEMTGTSLRGAI